MTGRAGQAGAGGAAPGLAEAPELGGMRWPEVDCGPRRLLMVPVGSLEQHGPHLPLDTDTQIAAEVAGPPDRPGSARPSVMPAERRGGAPSGPRGIPDRGSA